MKRSGGGIWGVEEMIGGFGGGVSGGYGGGGGGRGLPFDLFRAAKTEGALPELANTFSW